MREQDLTHAKLLLDAANSATQSSFLNLQIKTLTKYKNTANDIIKLWEKIGIKSKIEIVDSVPSNFQVFIGDFYLPMDPDQYMLWHSNQDNNITNYENKRIDKPWPFWKKPSEASNLRTLKPGPKPAPAWNA